MRCHNQITKVYVYGDGKKMINFMTELRKTVDKKCSINIEIMNIEDVPVDIDNLLKILKTGLYK